MKNLKMITKEYIENLTNEQIVALEKTAGELIEVKELEFEDSMKCADILVWIMNEQEKRGGKND